jgi:chromosome segregation ATPase
MTLSIEPSESVQEALARETARRKRVFLAFVGLLLVPIAIGAYALSRAPSETGKIVNDVTPIVTERVATQVTNDVVTRSEPLIRRNVSREIAATVEPRISSVATDLRRDLSSLQTTVNETSTAVAATTSQLASVSRMSDQVATFGGTVRRTEAAFQELGERQEVLRRDVDAGRQFAQALSRNVDRIDARLNDLPSRQQLAALQTDLAAIRTLANNSAQTANANRETLGSLVRRLSQIDDELRKLDQRVATIENRMR